MSRRTAALLGVTTGWLLFLAVPALADNCGTPSDCFGQAGSFNLAALGLLGLAGVSLLLDFVPGVGTAKGVVEAILGRDLLTGQKLSWWERGLGVLPVVGGLAAVAGLGRAARTANRLDDATDAVTDVTRSADNVTDAVRPADTITDAVRPADNVRPAPSPPRDPSDFDVDPPPGMTRESWYEELVRDPAHGGQIRDKNLEEREVGLALQERGDLPGPIRRDPSGDAEFIDAAGRAWDVKSYRPEFSNGFDLARIEFDMGISVRGQEGSLINTRYMTDAEIQALRAMIERNGWSDFVRWYP